ncbi:phospholipase A [Janthinobacterium fluminis]|uniref:Phospholipase A1 n=1 Tax=Janthinobacterium fluminis TaxID=2987524 RepID=A0ABT5JWM3_9BURK|nr:phospholipase A [Janthinobacterium fluminis]MDC8756959.1 phospholipase A [Janthinobacterium fluminis]
MNTHARKILLSSLLISPALALAGELEQQMLRCAVIGDASARLGCFDALTKTAEAIIIATGKGVAESAAEVALSVPAVASAEAAPPESPISRTVQRWELDDNAKRGLFSFRPHRDNYMLLANYSTASNDNPFRGFTPAGIKSQHVELTYQLSFKMKMAERALSTPVDIWFGYTQQSFWQAYNRAASSPFRETNYQPEVMAVLPIGKKFAGLDIQYLNFGLVHQSNGQTSTLSRSWNRLYAELGVDHGNFALAARLWQRLDNAKSNNDNIDITDYLGHGDVRATYRNHGHEFSLTARRNFKKRHGALQAGWAFPLSTNLKGYVQLFSGYGQSLIDYNYAQKSLGGGFLIDF